jgi:hypothetical protein
MGDETVTGIIRTRDLARQEAAIDWLFADETTRFYLEHHLSSVLDPINAIVLGMMLSMSACFPTIFWGMTYEGVYYPRGLFQRMLRCARDHKAVRELQQDYLHASVGDAAARKWLN